MILIADAGNTKTDWILADSRMEMWSFRTLGISPLIDHFEVICDVCQEVVAFFNQPLIEKIYFFGTGCFQDSGKNLIKSALMVAFSGVPVEVSDDLHGAGLALFGNTSGIVAIAGTGSNAGMMEGGKIVHRVFSLGYLLGDEGSGGNIGFGFLRELLSGRLSGTLSDDFFLRFHTEKNALLQQLYGSKKPQVLAASLLPFLHQHREQDEIQQIVKNSFLLFYQNILYPVQHIYHEVSIGFVGSVAILFEHELRQVFLNGALRYTPYWEPRQPHYASTLSMGITGKSDFGLEIFKF